MMSALQVARIPELSEMIIDHLHSDESALAACGAVCRGWLPSSRSRLFQSLELHPRNYKAFFRLLDSPFTTIAPYFRSLRIYNSSKGSGNQRRWPDNTLPRLTCLVGVRSLWLCDIQWEDLRAESRHALISSFKQVTRLSLRNASFDKFEELVELMCSYPLLEHIRFNDVFWAEKSSLASTSTRLPAYLRRLDLDICPKEVVIEWLFSYHSLYALDTVYLSSVTIQQMRPIALLLRNLGHNLHHLQIDFSATSEEDTEFFCHIVDLAHNDQLRSIRIYDNIHYNLHSGTTNLDQVAAVLSQIVSDHIELVELGIFHDYLLNFVDWSALANVFAKPQFAALRLIRIRANRQRSQDVADIVRKGLPDCDARGILNFAPGPLY